MVLRMALILERMACDSMVLINKTNKRHGTLSTILSYLYVKDIAQARDSLWSHVVAKKHC